MIMYVIQHKVFQITVGFSTVKQPSHIPERLPLFLRVRLDSIACSNRFCKHLAMGDLKPVSLEALAL